MVWVPGVACDDVTGDDVTGDDVIGDEVTCGVVIAPDVLSAVGTTPVDDAVLDSVVSVATGVLADIPVLGCWLLLAVVCISAEV